MEKSFPFSKSMHLCSKKEFDKVLTFGVRRVVYPVKSVFLIEPVTEEGIQPVQVAISVPKKLFKRAVKRNRLKRLIREAFRLTYPVYAPMFKNVSLRILYVYIHHNVTTQPRMVECINGLFGQMLDVAQKRALLSDASATQNL